MTRRGYGHADYTASLAEFGVPVALRHCGGWLLERPICGVAASDLMGPYPVFTCSDWSALADDVRELSGEAVSAVMVIDALAPIDHKALATAFPDHLVARDHLVRDLDMPVRLPSHHRRHVRRAATSVEVEVSRCPPDLLDDWLALYGAMAARLRLSGIRAFSRDAFAAQLTVPGLVAVRAIRDGVTVSITLWFEDAPNAHYHLGASNAEGYAVGASYALFAVALAHLRERGVRWVDLGGVPEGGSDGLMRFKAGWANAHRSAWLGGRVLDPELYRSLAAKQSASGWFPAYRTPPLSSG